MFDDTAKVEICLVFATTLLPVKHRRRASRNRGNDFGTNTVDANH
jgi:hypothetical protein